MPAWHEEQFMEAEDARKAADKCEKLAKAAARDGDTGYQLHHEREAAAYREIARKRKAQ